VSFFAILSTFRLFFLTQSATCYELGKIIEIWNKLAKKSHVALIQNWC
jgi:hypothetical protein